MGKRWWFVGQRYLSIAFAYENASEREAPWPLTVWIFDISVRPIFIIRIAAVWRDFPKCQDFVFLCA